jgi:hypothetical protein
MRISLFALLLLTSCAATNLSLRPPDLIVEGNEQSYTAFERAAEACGYAEFKRWNGAASIQPHYNLYGVQTRAAQCATNWVFDHPETGLIVSIH